MPRTRSESLERPIRPSRVFTPPPSATRPGGARIALALVRQMRPRQWVKNTACLAGLIFSGKLFSGAAQVSALVAMAMFCAASSSVYIINDIRDRENDRRNPKKAHRPIASGALPIWVALIGCAVCLSIGGLGAWYLGTACAAVLSLYLALNVVYSYYLKHAVIADVMVIAMGFVFRVLVGVFAVHERPTAWIVLCIFFLALFLGFAKRRGELVTLKHGSADHRPVLAEYTVPYLDTLLAMTPTMAIICYALFTVTSHKNSSLIVTIPPVVYGVVRYMLLVMVRGGGEAPDEILTRDKGLIATVLIWISLCVVVLYWDLHLFD